MDSNPPSTDSNHLRKIEDKIENEEMDSNPSSTDSNHLRKIEDGIENEEMYSNPSSMIRITQRLLKLEDKENFTDSNPLKLDSNLALGNHVRDSNSSNLDSNPQGKKSNPTAFQRLIFGA